MSNPNALLLLADHIKLSLLEQQRAKTLNLRRDSQDGHISRSLDQFREGLEALEKEHQRLQDAGDDSCVPILSLNNPSLF
jgi:syntaxin 8